MLRAFLRLYGEHDKRQHFAVSLLLFAASSLLLMLWCSLWPSLVAAATLTLLIGLGKEVWDHFYGSGFCWFDMVANLAGMLIGAVLVGLMVGVMVAAPEAALAGMW